MQKGVDGIIADRLRAGLWLVLSAILLFGAVELAFEPGHRFGLMLVKFLQSAVTLIGLAVVARMKGSAVLPALLLVLSISSLTLVSCVLRSDIVTLPVLLVILLLGTAVLFPWGAVSQALAAAFSAFLVVANMLLVVGSPASLPDYPFLAALCVLAASIYVAHQSTRQQVTALRREEERRQAVEELRRSEEYYRSLTENAQDLIAVLKADGTIAYASPSHERVLGHRPEDLVGTNAFEIIHPDDIERVASAYSVGLGAPGVTASIEARFRHRDGSWRLIEAIGTRVTGADGAVVVNSRDVTERKGAEERTKALLDISDTSSGLDREAVLDRVQRATAERLPCDCVVTFRVSEIDGIARLASAHGLNPEVAGEARSLGFEAGEVFEHRLMQGETFVADDMEAQSWVTRDLYERFRIHALIAAPLRVGGQYRGALVAFNQSAVGKFDQNQVELVAGIARQLSVALEAIELYERQGEEAEVASALARIGGDLISTLETPELLDRLCQAATEVFDADCAHTFLWQPAGDVFVPISSYGDSPEQWDSLRVLNVPREVLSRLLDVLARETVAQVVMSEPQNLLPPSLPQRYGITLALYVALRRGDEIIGIQTVACRGREERFTPRQLRLAREMSQMASMALSHTLLVEGLEKANRAKSDFVATMSHELRTPLNIVLGYTDLLQVGQFGPLTAEQMAVLGRVGTGGRQLLELVEATLNVSLLDSGRVTLALEMVDLPSLLREVDSDTRELQNNRDLVVQWQVPADFSRIYTDPGKLKIIVKNLLGNALKFTAQGTVTVSAQRRSGGTELCVTDTGVGIDPQVMRTIFEPFLQGDSSSTRAYDGVGLGLYIARQLVQVLGGKIEVESEVGHGSTFRVWIPAPSDEPHVETPTDRVQAVSRHVSPRRMTNPSH